MTKTRPVIAVDIDDVLASHAQAFIDFSNQRWGTSLTVDDYSDDWAMLWKLDRTLDVDREVISNRATDFFKDNTANMPHNEDAHEVLVKLKEDFELIVVTARRQQIKGETLAWIQQKYPGIFKEDRIYFAGFYDTIKEEYSYKNKGELLKELNADYIIDDQPKHCNGAMDQGVQGLLFGRYAWHDREPVSDGVVRVRDWNEVAEYFNAERQRI